MYSGLSDHFGPDVQWFAVFDSPTSKTKWRYGRSFSQVGAEQFLKLLETETWQKVYMIPDVSSKFKTFMGIFNYQFNVVYPIKKSHR